MLSACGCLTLLIWGLWQHRTPKQEPMVEETVQLCTSLCFRSETTREEEAGILTFPLQRYYSNDLTSFP